MIKNDSAIASYDNAIALKPDLYQAWYNRGLALSALGRHEAAIASYDKSLEIKPDYSAALNNKDLALSALGRKKSSYQSSFLALSPAQR